MKKQEILKEAKSYYELDLEYLTVEYNEMNVKIRMNKDHGRNHRRNDNDREHNLSLVSEYASGSNQNSYFENELTFGPTYIQKQVWGVKNWKDAKREILEFLEEIDNVN